jgi:hypothetical protein
MHAGKPRKAIALLTIPAAMFFLMQACALCLIMLTWRDSPVAPWLGFAGFGVAIAAFVCSLPALAALARSDIDAPLRYLLIAVHTLWFVIGGLILLIALASFVVRWIRH